MLSRLGRSWKGSSSGGKKRVAPVSAYLGPAGGERGCQVWGLHGEGHRKQRMESVCVPAEGGSKVYMGKRGWMGAESG